MNDFEVNAKPSKLVPVLIGAGAMTATAVIPLLNAINCLCCAGIMGGAVLGVYFYKKSFPEGMAFRNSDGTLVGTFAGIVAAFLTAVIQTVQTSFSGDGNEEMMRQIEDAFDQASQQGSDPAVMESVQQFVSSLMNSPMVMFAVVLFFSLIVFTGFGALGGLIGGNIFKTKIVEPPPVQY